MRLLLLLGTSIVLGLCLVLSPFNANATDIVSEEIINIPEPDPDPMPSFRERYPYYSPNYGWNSDNTYMAPQCRNPKKPDPPIVIPKDPRENL